ncbi:MAG: hypothetical protein ACK4F6_06880 [Hylemonella sp.]
MLDLRRLDPLMPGTLLEERRLFCRTAVDPSGLSRALLSPQLVNEDIEARTVTSDDLTIWELVGPPGRLDEAMQRSLQLHLEEFHLVQWRQVPLMAVASWTD